MINSNALEIKNLDFNLIKESFKSFLKNQNEFKDYNFEGSNINSLLDILSYNTYYNSFYMNMIVNESFLDSASQRSSIVSITKPIGFVPKSFKSAKIPVTITIDALANDNTQSFTIPKYSKFSSGSLIFHNLESIILTRKNDQFISSDVIILFEGVFQLYRYIVKDLNDSYTIPFKNIDLETLEVQVFSNLTFYEKNFLVEDYTRVYQKVDVLYDINQDSQVYFIQENTDELYSIFFGNDTLGKAVAIDNVIELKFLKSSGTSGNKLKIFSFLETYEGNSSIGSYGAASIKVSSISEDLESFDGEEKQDIEFIRSYAPYHFEAQNRIVTLKDYEYFISLFQANIEIMKVWGGEQNNPPRYGSVLCMIKIKEREFMNSIQKKLLTDYIKKNSVVGIDFIIIDPNIIYVYPSLEIKINFNLIRNLTNFKEKVDLLLLEFIANFKGNNFRSSDLIVFLRSKELNIKSLQISLKLCKNLNYILNSLTNLSINFNNTLVPGSIISSKNFSLKDSVRNTYSSEYFHDDSKGNIIYSYEDPLNNINQTEQIGTVDYSSGKIIIRPLQVLNYFDENNFISFYSIPKDEDIFSDQTLIFSLTLNQIERLYYNDIN